MLPGGKSHTWPGRSPVILGKSAKMSENHGTSPENLYKSCENAAKRWNMQPFDGKWWLNGKIIELYQGKYHCYV